MELFGDKLNQLEDCVEAYSDIGTVMFRFVSSNVWKSASTGSVIVTSQYHMELKIVIIQRTSRCGLAGVLPSGKFMGDKKAERPT